MYEEVEADSSATGLALTMILLSSLAAGVGSRGLGGCDAAQRRLFQRRRADGLGRVGCRAGPFGPAGGNATRGSDKINRL